MSTPLGPSPGRVLTDTIGIVPILRAGLGMLEGALEMLPHAEVWHIGLYRDEHTLRPVEYYNKLPVSPTVQVCLVLDPMLATGGSAAAIAATKGVLLRDERVEAASSSAVAASDRVRFGIIGVGMQGSGLLGTSIKLPGVECGAACDLYDGRIELAKEITDNPQLMTSKRYQDLLDNKDLDCIIAAVPDHWHKTMLIEAMVYTVLAALVSWKATLIALGGGVVAAGPAGR